jgi:hypothetical protein
MTRLLLFLFILFPAAIFSQTLSTSLDVPALTAGRIPSRSTEPVVTFDKRVLIIARGGPEGEVCLYINTRTGDLGLRYGRTPELGVCAFNVNDEKFRFTLIRATGQVQTYMTHNKNGVLKYYVSTGNTEVHPVSFPSFRDTTLHRQAETDRIPRETIVSQAYRASSAGPTVYLYGRTTPRDVTVQDFLGFGGIGYVKTNRGIFMATRADMGSMRMEVHYWQDVPTQLDMNPFESVESYMDNALEATMQREENKLRTETYSGECGGEEDELRRRKLADIASRRQKIVEKNAGNIYESERTRKATGELLMPNLEVMHQELEVKICRANVRLSRTRSETTRAQTEERIQCYRTSQQELSRLQEELNAVDVRYRNDAGRSYAEKVRLQTRLMSVGSSCR